LVNLMCYGLRLDRGCERRLSAFARRGKSGEICAFWQIEMKWGRAGLESGFFLTADGGLQIHDLKFQTRGYDILWRSCLCDGLELGW
jgi:hypothetical protein